MIVLKSFIHISTFLKNVVDEKIMNDILVKTEGGRKYNIRSVAACDDDGIQVKTLTNHAPPNNKQIICLDA